ncbi:MAG: hypothetical protein PHX21_02435 [bacterium]|nr:hypothetical protein [bacterium]
MGLNLLFLIGLSFSGVMGGPKDKPMIFRLGYVPGGMVVQEDYWTKVFEENNAPTLEFGMPTGAYFRLDWVVSRFIPKEGYQYAETEKLRRAIVLTQKFLAPKAFYMGFNMGMYSLTAKDNAFGKFSIPNLYPMGGSFGFINGMSPWHTYWSVGGGMLIGTEKWDLADSLRTIDTTSWTQKSSTDVQGWYGMTELGLIRQLRGPFALDLFVGVNYLMVNYTVGDYKEIPLLPSAPDKKLETIPVVEAGIGFIFAFPWYQEETIW